MKISIFKNLILLSCLFHSHLFSNEHHDFSSLKNPFKDLKISLDQEIRKDNSVLGPISFDSKQKKELGVIKLQKNVKRVWFSTFIKRDGGNNYGGELFLIGSTDYHKMGVSLGISYGVINLKAGKGVSGIRHQDKKGKIVRPFSDGLYHHILIDINIESSTTQVWLDGKKILEIKREIELSPQSKLFSFVDKENGSFYFDDLRIGYEVLSEENIKNMAKKTGVVIAKKKSLPAAKGLATLPKRNSLDLEPKGDFSIKIIDKNWICLASDYTKFMKDTFKKECASFLKELENNKPKQWSYRFFHEFAYNEVLNDYRVKVTENLKNIDHYELVINNKKVKISKLNYWLSATDQTQIETLEGKKMKLRAADINHFVFLNIAEGLEDNQQYELRYKGIQIPFKVKYDEHLSEAIKVNQIGYSPRSNEKYAYVGRWLGPNESLNITPYINQQFYLLDADSGKKVFEGTCKLRMKDTVMKKHKFKIVGEDVLELNFSSFKNTGNYKIFIDGIGTSFTFKIHDDAIGEIFYVNARGLYLQRCGIEKGSKYTNWPMGTCHETTYEGGFVCDDSHYRKGQFKDLKGNKVKLSPFDLIKDTVTDNVIAGVKGGWHDAADYDRRSFHLQTVTDLLAVFKMKPTVFTDGQLRIPESDNGIPDIVDEAIYGMEVWRLSQKSNGSVGTWIEATSHPHNPDPATDKQKYYLGVPSRSSSIDYAARALLLANVLEQVGQKELSKKYLISGQKAYNFAMDPKNKLELDLKTHVKRKKIELKYAEPENLEIKYVLESQAWLYSMNKNEDLKKRIIENVKKNKHQVELIILQDPFALSGLITQLDEFKEIKNIIEKRVFQVSDQKLKFMDGHTYRNAHYPTDHGYFTYIAWGNAIPLKTGKIFVVAHYLSQKQVYLDKLFILCDLQYGANPLGRSMTTGLGYVQPIHPLHLASYSDDKKACVPGITPYTYAGGLSWMGRKIVYGLFLESRKDHAYQSLNLSLITGQKDFKKHSNEINDILPFWRRYCQIGGLEVPQNEFTIWETIGRSAAVSGYLLGENWTPSSKLKKESTTYTKFHRYQLP